MRVLLLTDSLGCPREETCVSETWTDRIMTKWSGNGLVFYTYCIHGLSVSRIHLEYLREISPDVIIMQVGVVDACRRALGKYEFEVVSRIPVVSSIVKKICGKYHYFFTVVRNVHHCSQKKFFRILNQICEESIGSLLYIVWLCALWFHLNHGIWSALQTLGWSNLIWLKRIKVIGTVFATIAVGLFMIVTLYFLGVNIGMMCA